jgi:hypothetical protein
VVMQFALTRASRDGILCIMRTTITISDELLEAAQKLSGKSGYSEAIVTSLSDYVGLRKRLALLEQLFRSKAPHSQRQSKKARRSRRWSS